MNTISFEDLLKLVGTTGRYNFLLFYGCCIGGIMMAMHTFAYQFLGYTPEYWCHIDQLTSVGWTDEQIKDLAIPYTVDSDGVRIYSGCDMFDLDYLKLSNLTYDEATRGNNTSIFMKSNKRLQCPKRSFTAGPETIVTKWDLVCSRRALYSTTQAAVQGGMFFGSIIFGYLIDRLGRLFIYKICVVTYLITGFMTAFSPNMGIFILLKVVTAMQGMGYYTAGFILSVEFCTAKQRSYVSNYYIIPWGIGTMLTPAIAYVVRTWYWLEVALTAPALILLLNFWILFESPRWLIINERYEEAISILTKLAHSNGKILPPKVELLRQMKIINKNEQEERIKEDGVMMKIKNIFKNLSVLLVKKKYRMRTLGVFYCLFSASGVYYGVSLGADSISANVYLYIFLGGLIEIPSYILLWPAVVVLGRKKTYILLYLLAAFSLFSVMSLTVYCTNCLSSLKIVLYLCGKFAITAAFHLAWVYTAELYPTKYRSLIIGQAAAVGRFGSVCSPYINDILSKYFTWAPSAIFGLLSITAAFTALMFPETGGKNLPTLVQSSDTKEESEQQRKSHINLENLKKN